MDWVTSRQYKGQHDGDLNGAKNHVAMALW